MVTILSVVAAISAAVVATVQAAPPNTYSKSSTSVSPHYPHYFTTATSTYSKTKATWTPYSRKPTVGSYVSTTKPYITSTSQYSSSSSTKVHHSLPYSTPTVKPSYNSSSDGTSLFGPFNRTAFCEDLADVDDIQQDLVKFRAQLRTFSREIRHLRKANSITAWQERHIDHRVADLNKHASKLERQWRTLSREAKTCSESLTKEDFDRMAVSAWDMVMETDFLIDSSLEDLQSVLRLMVSMTTSHYLQTAPKYYYARHHAQARSNVTEILNGQLANLTQTDAGNQEEEGLLPNQTTAPSQYPTTEDDDGSFPCWLTGPIVAESLLRYRCAVDSMELGEVVTEKYGPYIGQNYQVNVSKIQELREWSDLWLEQDDKCTDLPPPQEAPQDYMTLANKHTFTKGMCQTLGDKIGSMVNKAPLLNGLQFQNVNLAQWIQVLEEQCAQHVGVAPAAGLGELLNANGTQEHGKANLTRRATTTGGGLMQSLGKLGLDAMGLCSNVDLFLKETQKDLPSQTSEAKRLSYELRENCKELLADTDAADASLGWKQVFDQMMEEFHRELCEDYGVCGDPDDDDDEEEEKHYYSSNSTMPEKRAPAEEKMFTDGICQSLGKILAQMTKKVPGVDGIKFNGMDISQLLEVMGAQCDQKLAGSIKSTYTTTTKTPYSHKPFIGSYVSTTTGSYPHKTYTPSKATGSYPHKTYTPSKPTGSYAYTSSKTTDSYERSTTPIPPHMARGATSTGPNGEVYGMWTTTVPWSDLAAWESAKSTKTVGTESMATTTTTTS